MVMHGLFVFNQLLRWLMTRKAIKVV